MRIHENYKLYRHSLIIIILPFPLQASNQRVPGFAQSGQISTRQQSTSADSRTEHPEKSDAFQSHNTRVWVSRHRCRLDSRPKRIERVYKILRKELSAVRKLDGTKRSGPRRQRKSERARS